MRYVVSSHGTYATGVASNVWVYCHKLALPQVGVYSHGFIATGWRIQSWDYVLEGYVACHCLMELLYCFTSFMHIVIDAC